MEKVTFRASFPAIQSALRVTGDNGGMRIQLDIPESEMSEAVKLLLYRMCVLVVTIEPEVVAPSPNSAPPPHTSAKQRKVK